MKNHVQQLLDAGQSVWLDNVRRSMFASGELHRLIDTGLRGMTSNPTIFEKAIGAGTDYDEQLATLIGSEKNADALFWDLAIQDIQSACDAFASLYVDVGRERRLRQPRGFAAAGPRYRRHDRDGQGTLGARQPPQRNDQNTRHQGRARRQSKSRSTAATISTSR